MVISGDLVRKDKGVKEESGEARDKQEKEKNGRRGRRRNEGGRP